MRNITVNGKNIPVDSRGATVIIYMEEFGRDILQDAMRFLTNISASLPDSSLISRITYAYIKTANEDIYKNYRIFMDSFKSIRPFIEKDNMKAILEETYDLLGIDTEKSDEEEKTQKKRGRRKTATSN